VKKPIYIIVIVLAALIVGSGLRPTTHETDFDIAAFSELPVQVGGRIKPIDSVARNTLLVLAGRQKVITPEGETLAPIEWFMDLTMKPLVADTYRVFKIEFPDDLGFAGLAVQGQRYYSFNDLRPYFEEISKALAEVNPEPKKRSAYEQQIADLNSNLSLYHQVMHSLHPIGGPERLDSLVDEYQSFEQIIRPGMKALRQQQADEPYDVDVFNAFVRYGDDYLKLSQTAHLRIVPPPPPADPIDDWSNIGSALLDLMKGDALSPYVMGYAGLTMSYRAGDTEQFNKTVGTMRQDFITDFPNDIDRVHFERLFNDAQPFYICMVLYVLIFLAVCISW
jgi:hypothetical protein